MDYSGQLHSYLVSPTEGFQENHSFSFGVFFRSGVTAVAYHPAHSLLFVAGPVMSRGDMQLEVFFHAIFIFNLESMFRLSISFNIVFLGAWRPCWPHHMENFK